MIKSREVPWDPDWIREAQSDLESMDPLEFWIAIEELELKLRTQNVEVNITVKVKTNEQLNP